MKKRFLALFLFLFFLCSVPGCSLKPKDRYVEVNEYPRPNELSIEDDFVPDEVSVQLTNAASMSFKTYTPADFWTVGCIEVEERSIYRKEWTEELLRTCDFFRIRTLQDYLFIRQLPEKVLNYNMFLTLKLKKADKENVLRAIRILERRSDVLSADPNYYQYLYTEVNTNDPYGSQWAADMIDLPSAWGESMGNPEVLVGVIDSGIDITHPDLAGKVRTDLSVNFVHDGTDGTSCTDFIGHGTHVAGIIAAIANNNKGIAGTAPNVKLVSLKVFKETTLIRNSMIIGDSDDVALAVEYATRANIDILNFSGGSDTFNPGLATAIAEFDGLFVCAAGNDGKNNDSENICFPANYAHDNIIAVGSCNERDSVAVNSNYGLANVDLFAPGTNVISCYPVNKCSSGSCASGTHISNGYHTLSGTSMATPFVTGTVALIYSRHPGTPPTSIKSRIMNNVTESSEYHGKCVSGGRLNAYHALHTHSLSYINTNNLMTHQTTCAGCGYLKQDQHSWVSAGSNLYRCSRCAYVTNILPYSNPETEIPILIK
ncbi:MAG: S8 family serine peptidase [Oscillospiraceae bacterium]|nr:S8 family serine peptidase [Oscillospiraceae bacterium]